MKKQLFNVLLCCLLVVPFVGIMAQTIDEGQSTEGTDFWVTFLKADQDANNDITLSLSISAKETSKVVISNDYTGYKSDSITVKAGELQIVDLYTGSTTGAVQRANDGGKTCYSFNSEKVDTCALHVTSTGTISLFASNYKKATFDATNVLPTASLKDSYIVQTYSPSDHKPEGVNAPAAGSHFAIVAVEDDVIVDYWLSVQSKAIKDSANTLAFTEGVGMSQEGIALANFKVGDMLSTPVLKKGQVWYVWTGNGEGQSADFSGTKILARDGKKIAVFQGNPHTNVPYPKYKERDHLFSQAMPTQYWGNKFLLTSSSSRKRDIFRVMALNDETTVYINGDSVKSINAQEYWEFELGDVNMSNARSGYDCFAGPACLLTSSCPCAVHLFIASKSYDAVSDGDPAMLWVNPIEQQIDQVTFATYSSKNGTTKHYVNIVTENKDSMYLDSVKIDADFTNLAGTSYYYARKSLGTTAQAHTLTNTQGAFIAYVYGFTSNESYGYSAGGATKPLTQYITISNGDTTYVFSPDQENNLCGKDTIHFACKPDFEFEQIVWHFGDGTPDVTVYDTITDVPHYYTGSQDYDATCSIYRSSSNICVGQSAVSVIKIKVTVGRYSFSIGEAKIPCPVNGVQGPGTIPYTSSINLQGNNVKVDFDAAAKADGFTKSNLSIKSDHFELTIPSTAKPGVKYGIQIDIDSDCGDTTAILPFALPVGNDVIAQRYNNVLGLLKDHPQLQGLNLSDFQWYRLSDSTALAGQVTSNLNMYDLSEDVYKNDEFYVCYWINKGQADAYYNCACSKPFITDGTQHQFATSPDSLIITATYSFKQGEKVFVNANWGGKTDIECYAQWITTDGRIYKDMKFNIPNGGCTIDTPAEPGLYMLRVVTDKKTRSFKFIIQ